MHDPPVMHGRHNPRLVLHDPFAVSHHPHHPQIAERKRTTERAEDYEALMDKLAAMLLAGCQRLGLLLPGGVLPPGVAWGAELWAGCPGVGH